ncbi:MFS transporter [Lentilactobacillus curieae]|uniref:MFS transporter n=1 Tax=Lentilactobacillus curieae TaxID=1138822 RepID=A0A1S6QHB7_9LACO|nr:MFS transporter [Lentilactobacillus curieae]AQW21000.1 MFS transporter [Lentilactobacillus curieae]
MNKFKLQSIVFVLVAFMLGCNEFMVVGVISDLAKSFHVSISLVGYLVTIFATVYAVSTPFVTILTSKYRHYNTLMVLMVVFLVGNTLSAFATNFWFMMISRIISAMTAGSIISLIMTFASQIAPREQRASLISWIFAGFSIASVFGVPIGVAISTSFGWRYAFWLISIVSIFTMILLGILLPKKVDQTTSTIKSQLSLLLDKRIYYGIILVLFTAATMYSYYTYIRPLLTTSMHFSLGSLNWLLVIIGIFSILSNRLSGKIAELPNSLGKMPAFYITDIILLSALPFLLQFKFIAFIVILALTLIVTILNAPIQIHFLNVAETEYPQSLVLASSLNSIFFNFGISLGSATASIMISKVGLNNISLSGAVYALLCLGLVTLLVHSIKTRTVSPKGKEEL